MVEKWVYEDFSLFLFFFFFSLEEMKFNPITAESLRQEKGYQKVLRKQQKDLESLKKRHQKEKLTVQKQHCTAIEKIIKGKKYVICFFFFFFLTDATRNFFLDY